MIYFINFQSTYYLIDISGHSFTCRKDKINSDTIQFSISHNQLNINFNKYHKYQMVQRVTYRRRLSYNTQSNKVRKVRTPGSKVVVQYVNKRGHGPRAPHDSCDCGKRINGIAQLRPYHYKRLAKKDKSVSRPYGGVLCGGCVKSRIIRAFLLEEIKTIKRAKQVSKK